jgi:hypothetical protein
MTLLTGTTVGQVRTTWTGVAGAPYYTGIFVDADATQVGDYAPFVANLWTAQAGMLVTPVVAQVGPNHPVYNIATGVLVGVGTSDESPVAGTNTAEMLPRATQVRVGFRTGEFINGRELRGGFYLPALADNWNEDGSPIAALMSDLKEDVEFMLFDSLQGFNNAGCVYSRTHGVAAYITAVEIKAEFAVLRSRRD